MAHKENELQVNIQWKCKNINQELWNPMYTGPHKGHKGKDKKKDNINHQSFKSKENEAAKAAHGDGV